jgi:ribonucleoside-triphosphate reductase
MAATLYPLMLDGVGNIDGVTPSAPNDIQSFSGQVTNLVFLLSSQVKGAVALGDYFIALNYYVIKEFGPKWYDKLDVVITNSHTAAHTIKYFIRKGMKQFIYGVNQPAGNRSYNSPFTNVSYYDKKYFKSLFGEFYYPDGTKPEWLAIDTLQRMFMKLHRELRLIKPLTFPVSTMALVHNDDEYLDLDYKLLCAKEWAKGGSFFCYTSDNPTSLASCCRVLNEIKDNTFSSTTGMTGVMTGSVNVITLNINRIVQDWYHSHSYKVGNDTFNDLLGGVAMGTATQHYRDIHIEIASLADYLKPILERVYKYHIAYKTMLYDLEDKGMLAASNAGYIYLKKLYSTIGVLGYCEAAKFLGIEVGNNPEYKEFLKVVLGTIKEQNKLHSIQDKKRPFLFNSEAVPGENLAVKLYKWDKADGYEVPENQNLYNCYFYSPWDENTSVLDKLKLHGKEIAEFTDGGQAAHINLDSHLSKEQYLKILDIAKDYGTNYFTFNIPMSECTECGHVVNAPIKECPKCKSNKIKYWTRIIGYLTCVNSWSNARQAEQKHRIYSNYEENNR